MDFTVEFYEMEDGRQPAREFLLSLDKKMRAKLLHRIVLLRDNGTALREPYSKPIGDGIFELRTVFSSNITRVLYFFYRGQTIILTNGFIKKTQKTPPGEIDRVKKNRADYLHRKEKADEHEL